MKEIKNLNELNVELDEEFRFDWHVYRNDFRLRTYFEKLFGIKLKRAYATKKLNANKDSLNWDCTEIVLALENGNFVHMDNSEWAGFELVKAKK